MVHLQHHLQVAHGPVGIGTVGLVDDKEIADFEDAGLDRLDIVTESRHHDDDGGVGNADDIDLVLADADGLDDDDVPAGGIEDADDIVGRAGEAAEMAAGAEGADKDAVIGGVAVHADAVAEDGAAGKGAGRIDGDDRDLEAAAAVSGDDLVGEGRLAGAGRAGNAEDEGAAGMGIKLFEFGNGTGHAVVDIAEETGSGPNLPLQYTFCQCHGHLQRSSLKKNRGSQQLRTPAQGTGIADQARG